MTGATPGIVQDADPRAWREHRFGLPESRWTALAGRTFWITGGGTGYGRALATVLAAARATVFVSGRRLDRLAETADAAQALAGEGEHIVALPCDITDPAAVEAAAAAIAVRSPQLAGVVNNAALAEPPHGGQPLQHSTPEEWHRLIATNLTGAWLVTRAALPHMARSGARRALFITSEAGWAFTPGMGPYNVSKAALNSLGAGFAAECAAAYPELDVQMNVLVAGEAATEMNRGSTISPYAITSMALALLSHPRGGPNGRFFHRDGRHLGFAYAAPYERSLFAPESESRVPRASAFKNAIQRFRT